ncbi:phosphotransferase [Herpetosiphon gulosus]|uniref:Homoserine kinase n=1 Tax=Herpetosiphon gulosus TaxID=1973496 RepID=A0ABP9X7E2_9CHLR
MDAIDTVVAHAIQYFDLSTPVQVVAHLPSHYHQSVHLRAANGDFVLKVYMVDQDDAALFYEQRLVRWLSWRPTSFAVPLPLRRRWSLDYSARVGSYCYSLSQFIVGETLNFQGHADDKHRLQFTEGYAMGTALSELQTMLQARPAQHRRPSALFQSLLTYMQPRYDPLRLAAAHVGVTSDDKVLWEWWRGEASELMKFMSDHYTALPHQICHNDYEPSNLLLRDGRVAAILDFEFACPAARALDVAMALRMIMHLQSNPINPWGIAEQFCHGYAEWITLTPQEIAAMPHLIRLSTAIPMIWAMSKPNLINSESLVQAIQRMQQIKTWMSCHHTQLIALLQTTFAT